MNQIKIYFAIAYWQVPSDPAGIQEGDQDYLVFTLEANYHLTFSDKPRTRLLVPANTQLAQQIKESASERGGGVFATSAENLKFISEPSFTKVKQKSMGDALLIKDVNKVEKMGQISQKNDIKPEPQSINFKVISQIKEKENQWGSYSHYLEIEPLKLGIEGLPDITKIEFQFTHHSQPTPGGFRDPQKEQDLAESELYKTQKLANSVGKTFTMKVNKIWIQSENELWVGRDNYVFNSFVEVKEQKKPDDNQKPSNNNSPPSPQPNSQENNSNQNPVSKLETWKVILITSGILLTLSLIVVFAFQHLTKKKNVK